MNSGNGRKQNFTLLISNWGTSERLCQKLCLHSGPRPKWCDIRNYALKTYLYMEMLSLLIYRPARWSVLITGKCQLSQIDIKTSPRFTGKRASNSLHIWCCTRKMSTGTNGKGNWFSYISISFTNLLMRSLCRQLYLTWLWLSVERIILRQSKCPCSHFVGAPALTMISFCLTLVKIKSGTGTNENPSYFSCVLHLLWIWSKASWQDPGHYIDHVRLSIGYGLW